MSISVITPCFNEEDALPYFYEEIKRIAEKIEENFEFIFVDDGSKDGTLGLIKGYAQKDSRVKYIAFSRNFGKEAAMYAGLKAAKGDYVCFMDADLQDPPYLLPEMYRAIKEEGYDSVATRRVTRKGESKLRSFFAKKFYKMMNRFSDSQMMDGARDYRLMNRRFVDGLLSLCERERFTKGMFGWVGFNTKWIDFDNVERVSGKTKWSFKKLFKYALGGIVAFSSAPLYFILFFGLIVGALSVISLITLGILAACGVSIGGWGFVLGGVGALIGAQSFLFGIYGLYINNIYSETKKRPIYIEKENNISK